jgi:hypothetical protein
MISSIAWVPAGVAAPVPSKYEMSATERELVRLMEAQGRILEGGGARDGGRNDDDEEEDDGPQQKRQITNGSKRQSRDRDTMKTQDGQENALPADLRMDEYSSDDDAAGGYAAGRLLVGSDDGDSAGQESSSDNEEGGGDVDSNDSQGKDVSVGKDDRDSISSDDDEEDDDLADVPDTREFVPVDVEGLAAMGLSQIGGVGGRMEFDDDGGDDDASDLDDVRLTDDDAIVLVAKTEEVRNGIVA